MSHLSGYLHYNDVTMSKIASQITNLTIVYSTVYSGPDQTNHQSSASLAFVRGIHRGPVNSPHKWPVTRKMFPFGDVIISTNKSNASGVKELVRWSHANEPKIRHSLPLQTCITTKFYNLQIKIIVNKYDLYMSPSFLGSRITRKNIHDACY